jgi:hypothetical protein
MMVLPLNCPSVYERPCFGDIGRGVSTMTPDLTILESGNRTGGGMAWNSLTDFDSWASCALKLHQNISLKSDSE